MEQQEICRACLKTSKTFSNIFECSQNNKIISELIMECVPVTIEKNDKLPSHICNACLEKLDYVYNFREMIIASNKILCGYQKNNETEEKIKDNILETTFIKEECDEDFYIKDESVESVPSISIEVETNFIEENKQKEVDVVEKPVSNKEDSNQLLQDLIEENNVADDESMLLDNISDDFNNSDDSDYVEEKKKVPLKWKTRSGRLCGYSQRQLQVLDNPDCKRIIESGLSRKEKARETVYCPDCKKSYCFKYYIDVHVQQHMGNLPFKCDICGYQTAKKYYLQKHAQKHSQTKNYLCTECGKAFSSKYTLKAHATKHSNERPFKCKFCEKAFKHLITLQNHELGHLGVKDFVCEECGRTFKHKRDLINHKATHTNEKNFECTTCGKKFLLKKGLDAHMKNHLGLKPYSCNICGKRFTAKSTWRSHARIHTGEKPFACKVCGKRFTQRECIVRHMRIHTGETPYSCSYCPEKFKYSQHMQSHMKRHERNMMAQENKEDISELKT
ncbi:hypothetical protein Trydic_g23450 [Trypoxylus dichotomus]